MWKKSIEYLVCFNSKYGVAYPFDTRGTQSNLFKYDQIITRITLEKSANRAV